MGRTGRAWIGAFGFQDIAGRVMMQGTTREHAREYAKTGTG